MTDAGYTTNVGGLDVAEKDSRMPQLEDGARRQWSVKTVLSDKGRRKHLHHTEKYDPYSKLLPLLIFPERLNSEEGRLEWLTHKDQRPSSINSLFSDLVFAALFSVFSSRNELTSGKNVGTFLAFFVLVYGFFLAQAFYDVRFEANDLTHRFLKLCQIVTLLYLGASSAGWAPLDQIVDLAHYLDFRQSEKSTAQQAFKVVSIVYAASRAQMFLQYIMIAVMAKRRNRPIAPFLIIIFGTFLSAALASIAAALHPSTPALQSGRVACLYVGVASEVVAMLATAASDSFPRAPSEGLSERLSGLTLVLLGEGFIALLRALNSALTAFALDDARVYTQTVAAVFVIWCTFQFLYFGWSAKHWIGRRRSLIFTCLHFPLHFCILLLLGAQNNIIHQVAYVDGMNNIIGTVGGVLFSLEEGTFPPADFDEDTFALRLGRLNMNPTWEDELRLWNESLFNETPYDAPILASQYIAQIFINAAVAYGVEVEDEVYNAYLEIYDLNATRPVTNETRTAASKRDVDILSGVINVDIVGSLWLFPAAGGVMLLAGLLAFVRYYHSEYRGRLSDFVLVAVGSTLCLLGLFGLGQQETYVVEGQPASPDDFAASNLLGGETAFQTLIGSGWSLPGLAIIMAVTYFVQLGVLFIDKRRTSKSSGSLQNRDL